MEIKKFKKMKKIKVKKNSVTNFENCVIKILLAISIITFILVILLEKFNDNDSDKVTLFQNIFIGLMGSAIISYVTISIPFILKKKKQYEKIVNMILLIHHKFNVIYYLTTNFKDTMHINEECDEIYKSVNDLNLEIQNSDFIFLSLEENITFINDNVIKTITSIKDFVETTKAAIKEIEISDLKRVKIGKLLKKTIDNKISITDFNEIIDKVSNMFTSNNKHFKNELISARKKIISAQCDYNSAMENIAFNHELYKILSDNEKAED